jgi:myo-inositol-1(or 4)-monophosphatase
MALEQKELGRMLETAVDAARLAGNRAIEEMSKVRAWVKSADQLVTQADTICQQIIVERIRRTYPYDGFIGEEGEKSRLFKQRPSGGKGVWWVIDPIDGTNNFAKGMLLFSIVIAAMHEGQPVAGVIYDPGTDSIFTGVKGGQAQCNGKTIVVNEDGIDNFSSIGMDSHFDNGVPSWAIEMMGRAKFRNLGSSSLQFAYLAKGGLIANISAQPKLWDIAAGAVIAESAGAIVSDWKGEKLFPMDLERYEGEELPTLATNKKVYREMLGLLK